MGPEKRVVPPSRVRSRAVYWDRNVAGMEGTSGEGPLMRTKSFVPCDPLAWERRRRYGFSDAQG